jgi:alpha-tubulin suppressor-like RCC1 family protein
MAITDKEKGVWGLDQVYNKINQGSIWEYSSNVYALMAFGKGDRGQNAQNDTVYRSSPVQIPGTTWDHLYRPGGFEYGNFGMATKTDGTLWAWGYNAQGQLGTNSTTEVSSPVQVGGDTTWSHGTQGYDIVLSIKTDGTLWGWGEQGDGRLGINDRTTYSSPKQIPGTTWSKVASGAASYGIKTDGTMYAWGSGANGQLAQNNVTQRSSPVQIPGTTWANCSAFFGGCYAVKTDGTLWAWGEGHHGTMGNNTGSPSATRSSPIQVGDDTNWSTSDDTILQAGLFGAAINTDGELFTWGHGGFGNLGHNDRTERSSPTQVPGTNWRSVHRTGRSGPGGMSMLATKTDNTLWGWGSNQGWSAGCLGQNNQIDYSSPVQISGSWVSGKTGGMNSILKAML